MSAVIAQAVAIGRQIAAQYRADTYTLLRASGGTGDSSAADDGSVATEESGGCVLVAGNLRPAEQIIADQAGSTSPYAARNMPYNSDARATDVLVIGGRRFEILGVLRAEAVNVAVTAICEERT